MALTALTKFKEKHPNSWQISQCLRTLAEFHVADKNFAEAEKAYAELSQAAELAGLAQALLSLRRDDLSSAQRLLEGIDPQLTGQFPGEPSVSAVAALIRARVLLADGDATGATALLSRLRETWGPPTRRWPMC